MISLNLTTPSLCALYRSDLESNFSATSEAFSLNELPFQSIEQDYIVPVLFAGKTKKGHGTLL